MLESELIRLACAGDDLAYETLVRQHQEAVFRLAYLFLGDADDAQDIAQETFIAAYRALRQFDSSRPLRPWLLRIVRNLALNRRRSVGRYLAALKRVVLALPTPVLTAEQESAAQSEAQVLWQAVRCLSVADQEVIYLRYFLELSVKEAAELLNVEPGTVKSRLSRALARLRQTVRHDFPLLAEGREI